MRHSSAKDYGKKSGQLIEIVQLLESLLGGHDPPLSFLTAQIHANSNNQSGASKEVHTLVPHGRLVIFQ